MPCKFGTHELTVPDQIANHALDAMPNRATRVDLRSSRPCRRTHRRDPIPRGSKHALRVLRPKCIIRSKPASDTIIPNDTRRRDSLTGRPS